MQLGELLAALAPQPDGHVTVTIPEDWHQGRTMFGGLNAALAARAARLADSELGPLRSAQVTFLAPAAGTVRYQVTTLRRGRSVTFVDVDCLDGEQLCTRAVLTFGRGRESAMTHTRLHPPDAAAAQDAAPIASVPGVTPAFLDHMELRFATGTPLLSGGEPAFSWWVRHRDPEGVSPESAALAVADVLPPPTFAAQSEFRPGSSVTWMVDLAAELPAADSWYLLSTTSDHAADGYSMAAMSCFSAAGTLVSLSRQTQAIF